MLKIESPRGVTLSYGKSGEGPPLLLIHGSFSDHRTNWELVFPELSRHFTVYAMARRGRGATDASESHAFTDEIQDAVEILFEIGEPAFLLGHSYGAHVALGAALAAPLKVRKLVLYEPPLCKTIFGPRLPEALTRLAAGGEWSRFASTFFREFLHVPAAEMAALESSQGWPPIVSDAEASYRDICALFGYDFAPSRSVELAVPVLLQYGTESPRHLYATDALAEVLPDVSLEALPGQAHEGMTTAPELYVASVVRFLHQY